MQPRAMILTGYGINCDEETRYAFEWAGAQAEIVHLNDLIQGKKKLEDYHILAFPGGFSYGDHLGSGNAFANKMKNKMWDSLQQFVKDEKLIIGICNGFQIMANLGLVPAQQNKYGEKQVALMHNDNHRYTCRWVDIQAKNDSVWLKGMDKMSIPIAHGEGKLIASDEVMQRLQSHNQIAFQYIPGKISSEQNLPYNPNGSTNDIAGITDESGRILGLMPHPERAMFFTQLPYWTEEKERLLREGKPIPKEGTGLLLFRNAVNYVNEKF